MDGLVDAVVDDTLLRTDALALHRQQGREDGCAHAAGDLQRARWLGTVADHTREIGNHVLDGGTDTTVVATHEIGDAHARSYRSHDASAEGRERAQRLLDVNGSEVAEHQGANELLLGVLVLLGIDADGVSGTDALVAAAGVAHDGNHGSSHTCVAGRGRAGDDMTEDAVAEDALREWPVDGLAQVMAVVAFEGLARRVHIICTCLLDEADLFERRCGGEVVDESEAELDFCFSFLLRVADLSDVADEVGVRSGDDGAGLVLSALDDDFDVELLSDASLELDVDAPFVDEALASLERLWGEILQHLELILAATDECAQGDGDGQAGHASAGYADAHSVLEDIGAEQGSDALRLAPQLFSGFGSAEGHTHGLCASDSRHHLAMNQCDDLLTYGLI